MSDLTGKTALITGATGGIGNAIARALHHQGATVAISGTRREVLDQFAGELKDRVHVLPCNLADKDEVEGLVPKSEEAMGQLDIWWPMPASRKIICWSSYGTRTGTRWSRSI